MTKRVFATAIVASFLLSLGSVQTVAVADPKPNVSRETFSDFIAEKIRETKMKKPIQVLRSRVGKTSYVSTGSSIYGWDCSGLVRWFYEQLGVGVPHSANKQAHIGTRVSKPKVGDIVVMARSGSTDFYHSGIYLGNRKVLNANRYYGTTVVEPLSDYKRSQIRYVRVDLNCWNNYRTELSAIENCESR
jgi:hypothetical protein